MAQSRDGDVNITGVYINLDRSEDRRKAMEVEIAKLSAVGRYRRFPAVDAGALAPRPDVAHLPELACYLSHLSVIRNEIGTENWLHILEDDVLVSPAAGAALEALSSQTAFAEYDIIFTNAHFLEDADHASRLRALYDRSVITTEQGDVVGVTGMMAVSLANSRFTGATSYLINPKSLGRVASLLAEPLEAEAFVAVDACYLNLARSKRLAVACTVPFFTTPRMDLPSTIGLLSHRLELGHRIIDHALYADRDVAVLKRRLEELNRSASDSVTADLMSEAYRYMVRVG